MLVWCMKCEKCTDGELELGILDYIRQEGLEVVNFGVRGGVIGVFTLVVEPY